MTKKEAIGALLGVLWVGLVFVAFNLSVELGFFVAFAPLAASVGASAARG